MTDYDHTAPVHDLAMANRTSTIGSMDHTGGAAGIGPPGDSTPPVVDSFSPSVGSALGPDDPVAFNVTDTVGMGTVAVMAFFEAAGLYEVVWDGSAFGPQYAGISTRTTLDEGHRYTIRRRTGWPEAPVLKLLAVDASGNITVGA